MKIYFLHIFSYYLNKCIYHNHYKFRNLRIQIHIQLINIRFRFVWNLRQFINNLLDYHMNSFLNIMIQLLRLFIFHFQNFNLSLLYKNKKNNLFLIFFLFKKFNLLYIYNVSQKNINVNILKIQTKILNFNR